MNMFKLQDFLLSIANGLGVIVILLMSTFIQDYSAIYVFSFGVIMSYLYVMIYNPLPLLAGRNQVKKNIKAIDKRVEKMIQSSHYYNKPKYSIGENVCPHCHSGNTKKNGWSGRKQKRYCKDCKTNFVERR